MKGKKIKILDNKVKVLNLKSLRCKIVIKFFVFDRKMENITRECHDGVSSERKNFCHESGRENGV